MVVEVGAGGDLANADDGAIKAADSRAAGITLATRFFIKLRPFRGPQATLASIIPRALLTAKLSWSHDAHRT